MQLLHAIPKSWKNNLSDINAFSASSFNNKTPHVSSKQVKQQRNLHFSNWSKRRTNFIKTILSQEVQRQRS